MLFKPGNTCLLNLPLRHHHQTLVRRCTGVFGGVRYYTNVILKELTEKNKAFEEEKMLCKIPAEYRYKNRPPDSIKMLQGDWKTLSPTQVRKRTHPHDIYIYDEIYPETLFVRNLGLNDYDQPKHMFGLIFILAFGFYVFVYPVHYFYFVMFHGLDEYLRFMDLDYHYSIECDKYAMDIGFLHKRRRNHPYHYFPEEANQNNDNSSR